jgi:hypothetical protein
LQKAFNIPHTYDYTTKLCRQQAKVIHLDENINVYGNEKGEAQHKKYKRLKLGGGKAHDRITD